MNLICQKCLTSRTGDVLGAKCQTPGCDGIIEEQPAFSMLVNELPEPMFCPRRRKSVISVPFEIDYPDRWQQFKTNGHRVCSYCGSLHPDDLFNFVKMSAEAPDDAPYNSVVEIEPSDKPYKIYVNIPGVRNAFEGGIKFYTPHLPRDSEGKLAVSPERQQEYATAVQKSRKRFDRHLGMMRQPVSAREQ